MADGSAIESGAARAEPADRKFAVSAGRKRLALAGAAIVAVGLLAAIGHWALVGRFNVSTDALAQAEGSRASQQAERAWASAEVSRYRPLAERGILSPARMQQIEIQSRQAGGGLAAADAAVEAARAQLEAAELDLSRTTIRAPIDGVVGDRQVQVGQLVRSGTPLMSVVPLQSVYVVANFKETQIARFHAGQHVTVRPDIAHNLRLTGVVDSIAPASGSEFSIIPTDTARAISPRSSSACRCAYASTPDRPARIYCAPVSRPR